MIQIIVLYLLVFAVFNTLVIILFRLRLFSNIILFYRGIFFIATSAVLTAGGFLIVGHATRSESIIAATLIAASMQVAFFVTVPVTLDRSISVFLLNRINRYKHGISKKDLTSEFVSDYVYRYDAIGRRMFEQKASKNIEISDGTITLSRRGRRFLRVSAIVEKLYGI